ncbi:TetR family transcriptional regulator [Agromyces mediolanus]|uniref:TetR family transcriptional regulator n=1 Tax=Agromyces mediolanus TaxID=41986 RepID=UPI003834B7EC
MPESTLREISRRAARARISEIAERLFLARGYDETTVEEIANEAGISERTFFRYFATKDEVLFGRFETELQGLVEAIRARPAGEAPWTTLQHALDRTFDELDERAAEERAALFKQIIDSSPHLLAGHLARIELFQRTLADTLWDRWRAAHDDDEANESDLRLILRALVGSFLAVVNEVTLSAEDQPIPARRRIIASALDAVRPARSDLGGA